MMSTFCYRMNWAPICFIFYRNICACLNHPFHNRHAVVNCGYVDGSHSVLICCIDSEIFSIFQQERDNFFLVVLRSTMENRLPLPVDSSAVGSMFNQ
ncbi:hypothetical protein X975_14551, partial [Stegodyphus mimosarum]